ncbi:MAG: NUDIX hydrolase [Calditrichota bacterium]
MSDVMLTHSAAVTGFVYQNGDFLLLNRLNPPRVWGPPGGRLEPAENPLDGIRREILEETGLTVDVQGVIDVWFGNVAGIGELLSISYLCKPPSREIRLSDEHSEFTWLSLEQLRSSHRHFLSNPEGFQLENFIQAEQYAKALANL